MTVPRQCSDSSAAAFTLLEMLVVVAIIALVATLAMPFLRRGTSDSWRLQATAHDLVGALRLTRAAAIVRNTEAVLVIDVDRRTFESPAVPLRTFQSDIVAHLKVAETERATRSRAGFRFFPDGSSTGGDLILRLHGNEARICVNWLNGEARKGTSC